MEIQGFDKTPGDLLGKPKKVYVLVTWDSGMPMVRSYEDEHDAIEILKDALPIRDRADLFYCDETGGWGRVPGW